MGGFFGVAAKEDCVFDLFFGTDYHSHLGTRRAGMAVFLYRRDVMGRATSRMRRFVPNSTRMSMKCGAISVSDVSQILNHSH